MFLAPFVFCAVGLMRMVIRIFMPNRHFSRPPGWYTGVFWSFATLGEVKGCLEAGADPNARGLGGNTPLHMAVWMHKLRKEVDHESPAIIAALLEAGADIEARNIEGQTPLHQAAANCQDLEVIGALVKAGADLNARTNAGETVLDCAAYNKEPSVANLLRQISFIYNLPKANE